ncbi:multiheme c-type cytochrome [Maioricimonas rarisocia]|uniref:multiheme c-type cytochrome n=1 Tax=Maioricimonas rarisocia TaxID=2528026 RepID=UPI0018D273B1|nr:multiheme c-type cytochrome [Maioricimonas rarisocia]
MPSRTHSSRAVRPDASNAEGSAAERWQATLKVHFAGNDACRECHTEAFEAHARSGHSHTAFLMAESNLARRLDGTSYRDPLTLDEFRFAMRGDSFVVSTGTGADEQRIPVQWLLGSGQRAQTAVAINGRAGIEQRWTAFAPDGALGVTPSHERLPKVRPGDPGCFGRPMTRGDVLSCLGCHMTFGPPRGAPLTREYFKPNIDCERCHGPRKAHVEAARMGDAASVQPMVNLKDPQVEFQLCAQCHRASEQVDPSLPEHEAVRFQPHRLQLSRCWQESAGQLACAACHDPHDQVATEPQHYTRSCLQCHMAPDDVPCPVEPTGTCIDCHMPEVDWQSGISFRDHWIRIPESARDNATPTEEN